MSIAAKHDRVWVTTNFVLVLIEFFFDGTRSVVRQDCMAPVMSTVVKGAN